jgi:bile acid-coenzyme A ligase
MPTSFVDTLREYANRSPQEIVIRDDVRSVSRSQLESRTNRLAREFAQRGVTSHSYVTLGLPNSVAFYEGAIAAWKLGATPQPISNLMPEPERNAILDLLQPDLLVGFAEKESGGRQCLPLGFEPSEAIDDSPLPGSISAAWKAVTSGGSTGRPKVIVATQSSTTESVVGFAPLLGMTRDGVHLVTGPLGHNGPFLMSTCALLTGNRVVVMPKFEPLSMLSMIEEHQVDWVYAVPTMMHRIWRLSDSDRNRHDLSSLRVLCHMAAACPRWLKRAWIDWLGPLRIREVYGGTEAQAITVIDGDEWLAHPGSVGKVRLGEMAVLNGEGSRCPVGEVGEIWMRRDAIGTRTYEYVGSEPKSRPDGWESIGDLGSMDADGYLYIADRVDDTINRGGLKVYPAEVEAALEAHPAVRSACVIGIPDDELGAIPHAIVEVSTEVSDDDLVAHLRTLLVPYKIPVSFERSLISLRNDAGKVRRSELRDDRMALPKSE